jgi:hypothetical protein
MKLGRERRKLPICGDAATVDAEKSRQALPVGLGDI